MLCSVRYWSGTLDVALGLDNGVRCKAGCAVHAAYGTSLWRAWGLVRNQHSSMLCRNESVVFGGADQLLSFVTGAM